MLDTERIANDDEVGASLDTLVKILRPGAVVLDDIDRVGKDARLLRFLEESSAEGRLVLASANCTATMLGALLRPGRGIALSDHSAQGRGVMPPPTLHIPSSQVGALYGQL